MTFSNGATYTVEDLATGAGADVTDDCKTLGDSTFHFRATGAYRGVRRSLEISQ